MLTHEMLHAAGTGGCGFTKTQVELMGSAWPPRKGWLSALIGKRVPREVYERFLSLKGHRAKQGEAV